MLTDRGQVRAIAFYLPQFYPIPENDAWWGKGFTEWTNVTRARPLFRGHYQPHLPADLGFYDLRVPETRQAQADLARQFGIYGFCYYHYWLAGTRLLERPFSEVLASGKPDFPFCLCWANHNWTRRWDGQDQEVLIEQKYSVADDLQHIQRLIPVFRDPRYIQINGRPLLLVIRVNSLPDPARTARVWREEAVKAGLPGLYLCTVTSLEQLDFDPALVGFDAAVDFQPRWLGALLARRPLWRRLRHRLFHRSQDDVEHDSFYVHRVCSYSVLVDKMISRPDPSYRLFPGVTPGWDNSSRRRSGANIFLGSTPELYGRWVRSAIATSLRRFEGDEQLVFINAWNEWAEGNHLEPDQRWGHRYLEETRDALAPLPQCRAADGAQ